MFLQSVFSKLLEFSCSSFFCFHFRMFDFVGKRVFSIIWTFHFFDLFKRCFFHVFLLSNVFCFFESLRFWLVLLFFLFVHVSFFHVLFFTLFFIISFRLCRCFFDFLCVSDLAWFIQTCSYWFFNMCQLFFISWCFLAFLLVFWLLFIFVLFWCFLVMDLCFWKE